MPNEQSTMLMLEQGINPRQLSPYLLMCIIVYLTLQTLCS